MQFESGAGMGKSVRRGDLVVSLVNSMLIDLAAPSNINYWWNFGILLGVCLGIQIVSGVLLAMHYSGDADLAFNSVMQYNSGRERGLCVAKYAWKWGVIIFCVCIRAYRKGGIITGVTGKGRYGTWG